MVRDIGLFVKLLWSQAFIGNLTIETILPILNEESF